MLSADIPIFNRELFSLTGIIESVTNIGNNILSILLGPLRLFMFSGV
jgi:hypothetical protein